MIMRQVSEQKPSSSCKSTCPKKSTNLSSNLICSREGHSMDMSEALDLSIEAIQEEQFNRIVVFILHHMAPSLVESCINPVCLFRRFQILVVFNHCESWLEFHEVHLRVEKVFWCRKSWHLGSIVAAVLFFSKILVELSLSEFVVAVVGFVLTGNKLLFKLLNVSLWGKLSKSKESYHFTIN